MADKTAEQREVDSARLAEIDRYKLPFGETEESPTYREAVPLADAVFLRRLLREAEAERDEFRACLATQCGKTLAAEAEREELRAAALLGWATHAKAIEADRDRAVAEARRLAIEECAKEVCVGCREGIPLGATVSSGNAIAVFHLSPSGMNLLPCSASGIRALLNEVGQ